MGYHYIHPGWDTCYSSAVTSGMGHMCTNYSTVNIQVLRVSRFQDSGAYTEGVPGGVEGARCWAVGRGAVAEVCVPWACAYKHDLHDLCMYKYNI